MTELEKKLLKGFTKSDFYEAGLESTPWMFSIFDAVNVNPKLGRGAISSLVKKGYILVGDYENKNNPEAMFVTLTDKGKEYLSHNLLT